MKRFFSLLPYFLFVVSIFWVFKYWFLSPMLTGGDFWYYFPSMYTTVSSFQYGWIPEAMNGLGGVASVYQPIHFVFSIPIILFGFLFHVSWGNVVRFGFFFPFIIFGVVMPFVLFRKVFPTLHINFALLSSFIFLFNTYVLLLTGGGQINLANACILGLLLLYLLITFYEKISLPVLQLLPRSILLGVVVGLITVWDIRFAYITLLAYFLFFIISLRRENFTKNFIRSFIFFLAIPGFIAVELNAFWIVQVAFLRQNPLQQLGAIYSTIGAVQFFSFAKLENSLGLLHPNWPENIFGLTHFMQPEFLLLPILAFSSLFFVHKSREKQENLFILYFALLGLTGAFLAKGANDPFGGIYLWLFNHAPGFILFRDPSKWYFLTVISYITLIPYATAKISELLEKKRKFRIRIDQLSILFLMVCVIFLVRPAFLNQLGRTFTSHTIPQEYKVFEQFLTSNKKFSRTLWVPTPQRFGLNSALHPMISAEDFFHVASVSGVVDVLQKSSTESLLQQAAVQYVIVPYDSEKEIFIQDRKYNNALYTQTVREVNAIPWLTKVSGFGTIAVFQVPDPKDHFYLLGKGSLSYIFVNPTKYQLTVKNAHRGDVVIFSETFDPHWKATIEGQEITSHQLGAVNSFTLPKNGNYTFLVSFLPQKYVEIGIGISLMTSFSVFVTLISIKLCNKIKRSRNSAT